MELLTVAVAVFVVLVAGMPLADAEERMRGDQ